MTMRFARLSVGFASLCFALSLFAQSQPTPKPSPAARPVPSAPELASASYILADFHSGKVLTEKGIDERVEPASITKIMTSYMVYQALAEHQISRQDLVKISEKAWKMEGSKMFIEVNKLVSVEDLIKGMVIQSGNDASVALAEHIAGSESAFVSLMNAEAEHLGMKNTHYMNATGLPDADHYSTAADILTLTKALIQNFPQEYVLYSQKDFTFNDIKQSNRNRMLWIDKRVDGVKTGHTESAGFCLVVSAEQDGMRLISVVLGTASSQARTEQSQSLINYGFRFYETRELFSRDQELAKAPIWKGDGDTVSLGIVEPIYVTFPKGQFKKLKTTLDRPVQLMAPVTVGDKMGSVVVSLGGEPLHKTALVALNTIEEGGFFSRMIDSVMLMLE